MFYCFYFILCHLSSYMFYCFYFILCHPSSYMQTPFMRSLYFTINVIHLIKNLEYAEFSKGTVSLYLGCCSGVRQSTLTV